MKDPGRLVDEHPSPLARSLLSAARAEEPQSSLLENTLMATIGAMPLVVHHPSLQQPSGVHPVTTVTATSASAAGVKAMSLFAVTVKWVGIASVGGALTFSGVRGYRAIRPSNVAAAHQPARVATKVAERSAPVSSAPTLQQFPADPNGLTNAPSAPRPTKAAGPSSASAASPQALLSEEARLIDDARAAIARGNGSDALRVLDAHRRRFERPRLRPEALYLRMQALRLQGNVDAAARVAERLLADYPNGTQSAAARALLNTREP